MQRVCYVCECYVKTAMENYACFVTRCLGFADWRFHVFVEFCNLVYLLQLLGLFICFRPWLSQPCLLSLLCCILSTWNKRMCYAVCVTCPQVNDVVIVYDQQKQKPRGMFDWLRALVVGSCSCLCVCVCVFQLLFSWRNIMFPFLHRWYCWENIYLSCLDAAL